MGTDGVLLKRRDGFGSSHRRPDQVQRAGSRKLEHPVRVAAEAKGLLRSESVVLVDGLGKAIPIDPEVDVSVLTPRTEYASGRPLWMTMGGRREPVAVEVPECADNVCVLKARDARRPDSVPLDRVEVAHKGKQCSS